MLDDTERTVPERVAQRPQVQVPVDATELLAGLDHPRGGSAQRIVPSRQFLTLLACVRQIEIMLSTEFVERNVRASVGGMARRSTVRVSAMPPRRLAAVPGWVRSSSAASELGQQGSHIEVTKSELRRSAA
jgi:hypothetical protein